MPEAFDDRRGFAAAARILAKGAPRAPTCAATRAGFAEATALTEGRISLDARIDMRR
jgi:hypothetical protein